jgi:tetratricopeptide (TPR) repeat protein
MRFIRGESMQEAIARFHAPQAQGLQPLGFDSLMFRDLLGRFVAVCHTIAYAHSRGVIHRDLKPSNVMLGEYGETLVVDWGLARTLDQPDGEQTTAQRPVQAGSGTTSTEMGQVVGTPAYMPPEQAEGRLDLLGPSSDVFSMGATLYCLLTGQAPYTGREAMVQARRADVVPARQRKRSVPAALEAVCGKAMAKRAEERYGSAKALAEEVQRFLADEPVSAYREPVAERVRRWTKRHRSLVAALAMGVLTATVGLAVGLVVVNVEKENTRKALERSHAAETSASDQRQLALKTVRMVADDIHAGLKDRPGQKGLRKKLLARAMEGLKEVARAADTATQIDHATIWVYIELGDIFLQIEEGGTQEAKKYYERAHELACRLADADPGSAVAQRDLGGSYERLGNVQVQLGDPKAALAHYQSTLAIYERLAKADAQNAQAQADLGDAQDRMGDVLRLQLGDPKLALAHYQSSLAIFERLAKADPPNAQAQHSLAISYIKVGTVLLHLGDSKAALPHFQSSLAISERAAKPDPQNSQAQLDLSIAYDGLGDVQMRLGDSKAALAHFQNSLAICERLAKADPQNSQAQRNLGASYFRVGDVQMQLRNYKAALAAYRQCVTIGERLASADPQNAVAQDDLLTSYLKVGNVEQRVAGGGDAARWYAKALATAEVVAANAKAPGHVYDAACAYALCVLPTDTVETKEKRSARAVALLRQAVAQGFKDVAHMKRDTDLDVLRTRDDFKRLLAEMESAAGAKKAP